jgi:hypothetical protein
MPRCTVEEIELVAWINRQNEKRLPPLRRLVRNWASEIAEKPIGESWVGGFLHRHQDELIAKWTKGMDRDRHQADSWHKHKHKHKRYFDFWHAKMEQYLIEPRHMYNMDEKGLMLGITNRSKRVFTRRMWEKGELRSVLRDGSREWVTIFATICGDGTTLDPYLIYQSDASTLQSSWVHDISPDKLAFTTASTSGWTNNEIGLQWLRGVFDRLTKDKARQSWRLLILDGHESHTSMAFINYCDQNRILLAVFPPHATHTLQPLDVVMFKSLSANYSTALEQYMDQSLGALPVAKKDFFSLFWDGWVNTFIKSRVLKSFSATGLSPPNANVILKRFAYDHSDHDSSSLDDSDNSLSNWIKIQRRLRAVTTSSDDRKTQALK